MITKAIEAGARAIYENWANYPACSNSDPWSEICEKRSGQADDFRRKSKACIKATIASGELVPASAVAAERERCAKLVMDRAVVWASSNGKCSLPLEDECLDISAAIRALEPASGECSHTNKFTRTSNGSGK